MSKSLPILKTSPAPSAETLIRYFHQTESKWTDHISESSVLDWGTAWCNPQLPRVPDANRMLDVVVPIGQSPEEVFAQTTEHFKQHGSSCRQWVMNSSTAPEQTSSMVHYLQSVGYSQLIHQIMYLDQLPSLPIVGTDPALRIIPARASFRHARLIHEEGSHRLNEPQLTEAALLHLDDPHYDALLALLDGKAVATVGVLAAGEVGRIEELFVSESFRRRHIGLTMMSRALEICARSLFKHVILAVLPENTAAISLYEKFGFRTIGQYVAYQAPPNDS